MQGNDKMAALAIDNLAQSLESIKRIGKELNDIESSEAFKEYRFITQ